MLCRPVILRLLNRITENIPAIISLNGCMLVSPVLRYDTVCLFFSGYGDSAILRKAEAYLKTTWCRLQDDRSQASALNVLAFLVLQP